jgi:sulfite exporter TauE/SafE
MDSFTLSMAFLMGMTGSLHCAGMCGPIVLVMPFQHLLGIRKIIGILAYHTGRIAVYVLLGWLLFRFKNLFSFQLQQYLSVGVGALLFLAGIFSLFPNKAMHFALPWTSFIRTQLGKLIGKARLHTLFLTGIFNGLLPCGMVYMALSAAISTSHSQWFAMSLMAAFGLGTMPMLLAFTLLKNKTGLQKNNSLRRWIPLLMAFFGLLFILRGLGLGIPYLSPKAMTTPSGVQGVECH